MNDPGYEQHLFILWNSALPWQEEILADIEQYFTIVRVFTLRWSEQHFSQNMSRFYGQKLPSGSKKERQCGRGPFLVVIVQDKQPMYAERTATAGKLLVNSNMFDAKERYRKISGGGHRIHGTNSVEEFEHDYTLLFGLERHTTSDALWDGTKEECAQDLIGATGWKSLSEFFLVLNKTIPYVVLRNFEGFPSQFHLDQHADIDLLVANEIDAAFVTNATKIFKKNYRVHYHIQIDGVLVPFDFRSPGDGYYDHRWETAILEQRLLNKNHFYTPDLKNYFYSLLYHALIHKKHFASDYHERLIVLAATLPELAETPPRSVTELQQSLIDFMETRSYIFSEPVDRSVLFLPPIEYSTPISRARRLKRLRKTFLRPIRFFFRKLQGVRT